MNKRKRCTKCKARKNTNSFGWKKLGVRKQSHCRQCMAKASRKHYKKNHSYYIKRNKKNQSKYAARSLEFVRSYLLSHFCVDCKNNDIRVLEFDHLRDKKYNINSLMHNGVSLVTLQREIDKCDVVCANCHRIRTYARMKSWRNRELSTPVA